MSAAGIDYRELTCEAFRGVMAKALLVAAEKGLPGDHHFYITLLTDHPGVVMPDWLRADYPDQITIVIQHEYGDLAVSNERFSVTLSFKSIACTLVVPFSAVVSFVDPSVNFRLEVPLDADEDTSDVPGSVDLPEDSAADASADKGKAAASPSSEGTVVSLDSFRKK